MDKEKLFGKLKKIFRVKQTEPIPDMPFPEIEDDFARINERARMAKELINNPILSSTINSLKAEFIKGWKDSQINDTGNRELYYLSYKILEMFETRIKMVIEEAELLNIRENVNAKEN